MPKSRDSKGDYKSSAPQAPIALESTPIKMLTDALTPEEIKMTAVPLSGLKLQHQPWVSLSSNLLGQVCVYEKQKSGLLEFFNKSEPVLLVRIFDFNTKKYLPSFFPNKINAEFKLESLDDWHPENQLKLNGAKYSFGRFHNGEIFVVYHEVVSAEAAEYVNRLFKIKGNCFEEVASYRIKNNNQGKLNNQLVVPVGPDRLLNFSVFKSGSSTREEYERGEYKLGKYELNVDVVHVHNSEAKTDRFTTFSDALRVVSSSNGAYFMPNFMSHYNFYSVAMNDEHFATRLLTRIGKGTTHSGSSIILSPNGLLFLREDDFFGDKKVTLTIYDPMMDIDLCELKLNSTSKMDPILFFDRNNFAILIGNTVLPYRIPAGKQQFNKYNELKAILEETLPLADNQNQLVLEYLDLNIGVVRDDQKRRFDSLLKRFCDLSTLSVDDLQVVETMKKFYKDNPVSTFYAMVAWVYSNHAKLSDQMQKFLQDIVKLDSPVDNSTTSLKQDNNETRFKRLAKEFRASSTLSDDDLKVLDSIKEVYKLNPDTHILAVARWLHEKNYEPSEIMMGFLKDLALKCHSPVDNTNTPEPDKPDEERKAGPSNRG